MNFSLQNAMLSNAMLARHAPSAFAQSPHSTRSARYGFVPTSEVINALRHEGFYPVAATQAASRDEDRLAHAKHMIRFRRDDEPVDGLVPEVIMVNSHDGSSGYQLMAGLFRFVCLNGLMLSVNYRQINVAHRKEAVRDVIEGSYSVIKQARLGMAQATAMSRVELNRDEQMLIAIAAHRERFAKSSFAASFTPEMMLGARRPQDKANDLFTVMNRIQEHSIRGGLSVWERSKQNRMQKRTTRQVQGIDQSVDLNRKIWQYAEQMLALKAA